MLLADWQKFNVEIFHDKLRCWACLQLCVCVCVLIYLTGCLERRQDSSLAAHKAAWMSGTFPGNFFEI